MATVNPMKELIDDRLLFAIKQNFVGALDGMLYSNPGFLDKRLECHEGGYGTKVTALHIACYYMRPKIVTLLLEMGADVNPTNAEGVTPLWLLNRYTGSARGLIPSEKLWSKSPVPPNNLPFTNFPMNALIAQHIKESDPPFGTEEDYDECLKTLLKFEANPNTLAPGHAHNERLVLVAEMLKQSSLLKYASYILHNAKMDVRVAGSFGLKMLTNIAKYGTSDGQTAVHLFGKLADLGADLEATDEMNRTILHQILLAIPLPLSPSAVNDSVELEKRMLPLVQFILSRQCSPARQDVDNETPLHLACARHLPEIVNLLVSAKHTSAQNMCRIKNGANQTPLVKILDDQMLLHQLQQINGDKPHQELDRYRSEALQTRMNRVIQCLTVLSPKIDNWADHVSGENNRMSRVLTYLVNKQPVPASCAAAVASESGNALNQPANQPGKVDVSNNNVTNSNSVPQKRWGGRPVIQEQFDESDRAAWQKTLVSESRIERANLAARAMNESLKEKFSREGEQPQE